jgi:hypothetical protein
MDTTQPHVVMWRLRANTSNALGVGGAKPILLPSQVIQSQNVASKWIFVSALRAQKVSDTRQVTLLLKVLI